MTNYQMARKAGLVKPVFYVDDYKDALRYAGLEIISDKVRLGSMRCIEAKLDLACGTLRIYCGTDGTARIDKPNETHKWVYEKTPAQITALLRQTLRFYGVR